MSGGGTKFVCGMRRFDKHTVANERPQNQQLHNETEKQLAELLQLREQQNQGIFTTIPSQYCSPNTSTLSKKYPYNKS